MVKRHPSLRDLSVDHHHGLVHARRLIKACSPESQDTSNMDKQEVAGSFLRFFSEHTNRHFREEEEVLLPAFARFSDLSDPSIAQMLMEHIRIRRHVSDLQQEVASGSPSAETMLALGALLQAHIRFEENVVFPLIERAMPEEALIKLAEELSQS